MSSYRHPFKEYVPTKKHKVDKEKLRAEVKAATQEYLKSGKKIEKVMDGPIVKVPSVGLKDLGNELSFGIRKARFQQPAATHPEALNIGVWRDGSQTGNALQEA